MNEKIKNLVEKCLNFVNEKNDDKHATKSHKMSILKALLDTGYEFERDASTNTLILDEIESGDVIKKGL